MTTRTAVPDPPQQWTAIEYSLAAREGKDPRERAELETNRDLNKPIEQLLCDFHDVAEQLDEIDEKDIPKYIIHAQKRMVGMMAKVVLANDKLTEANRKMTWAMLAVSAASLICGIIALLLSRPS